MAKIDACSTCGEVRPLKGRGLCVTCYNREHAKSYTRPEITCSNCGKLTDKYSEYLCSNCYAAKRRAEGKKSPEVVCKGCGRTRPHAAHGLCASCHAMAYKKKNDYKGPIGTCTRCGLVKNIHAKGMCHNCYSKEYDLSHKEERKQYYQLQRKLHPEKFRAWGRKWRDNNREHVRELGRKFYHNNIEKMREKARAWYRADPVRMEKARIRARLHRLKPGMVVKGLKIITKEARIEVELAKIPELKRVWVAEFLKTAFSERSGTTKLVLILHINRLIGFLQQVNPPKANAGWNALEITDIDRCQVETGMLKDSLRVFFRWLKKRKAIMANLVDAVPVPKNRMRASKIPKTFLQGLFERWTRGDDTPNSCIAGLLIIYFGMTNEELRNLKVHDFKYGKVRLDGKWLEVDSALWDKILAYLRWREEFYFGRAPEYFFVTGISVTNQRPVGMSYVVDQFKLDNISVTPSELRKAMIQFHKKNSKMDPAMIASLFRISPKGASRHF